MPTEPEYAAPDRSTPREPDGQPDGQPDPNARLRDAVDAATDDPRETGQQRARSAEPAHDHDPGRMSLPTLITPIEDPEATYNHTLAAKITAGAHIVATTTAQWIRLIAEFDERDGASFYFGINGTAHFLSVYCSTGTSTAREHVRVARSLARMPLIAAAFDAGRLSYSKVRECARIAGDVDEHLLLEYAEALSAAQLEASIRTFRRTRRDRLEAEQLRTASWSISHDGTVTLRAVLPAEDGARVIAALEKALDYLNSPSHAAATAASLAAAVTPDHSARQRAPAGAPDSATGAGAPAGTLDADLGQNTPAGSSAPAGAPHDPTDAAPGTEPPQAAPLPFTRADALLELAASYLAHAPRDHSGADRDLVVVHVGARHATADHSRTRHERSRRSATGRGRSRRSAG